MFTLLAAPLHFLKTIMRQDAQLCTLLGMLWVHRA